MTDDLRRPIPPRLLMLGLAVLLVSLAALAATGAWSRYAADDYCTAGTLRERGFWGSQAYWYSQWSGRYSFYFTVHLVELLGPVAAGAVPSVILATWLAGLTWALAQPFRRAGWGHPTLTAGVCAAGIIAAVVSVLPDTYQSLNWLTGAVTYSWPMALLTLQIGVLVRNDEKAESPVTAILAGLLAWWTTGFNEIVVGVQAGVYAIALWSCWRRRCSWSDGRWRMVAAGVVGTLVGAAVSLLAPGNQLRLDFMPDPPGPLVLAAMALRYAAAFAWRSVRDAPFALAALALMMAGLGRRGDETKRWRSGIVVLLGGGLVLAMAMVPSAYATSAYPPDRALVAPALVLAVATAIVAAKFAPRRPSQGVLLLGCLVLSLLATKAAVTSWNDAREYARQWEKRDAAVVEARRLGVTELTLSPSAHIGDLAEVGPDPREWVNLCFASYYGLESVTAQ